ncbi:MAG: hypothetical protein GWP18_07400 [Proteobacteria bacterium]|nr:hypothetical protein [Pseudomonadota bacterium]
MTTETLALDRIETSSPLRGLGGLIGVELRVWFPWRVLWLVVAGLGTFAVVYLPWRAASLNQLGVLINFFLGLWTAFLLISTVSMTEGAVLGEIHRGTAAWLAALPIARPSVILAKFVGAMAGLAGVVGITGLAVYPILVDADGRGVVEFSAQDVFEVAAGPIGRWGTYVHLPTFGTYMAMLVGLWLLLCFIASVMMLLGSLVRSRTATFGLGLVVVGAIIAVGVLSGTAVGPTPAGLAGAIIDIALGNQTSMMAPVIGTLILTLGVLAIAVMSFDRRELS